ncbi:hypothetical protein L2K70_12910 [Nocardioides KLBMP 9356]|uniref:DUF4333 domain-containing protein n=1 Tax=Nocardioides potassii TaxID=2911371 RepID=A0ABS9HBF7_9ACTN|nr:hypothetical protein [Nocardioides potassii]MCF6378505.1 hypothetical protein [Nocardioides potassii]
MVRARTLLGAVALGLLLTGCGDDPGPTAPQETAVDDPTETPSGGPSDDSSPVPGADAPDVRASVDDLAAVLGIDAADVTVVAVQEVAWSDGSRGCAKKGMTYTMSIIEGARITLEVDGTTYEYHSGGSRPPFLCERPTQ